MGAQDERILELTDGLCSQFAIEKFKPRKVVYLSHNPKVRRGYAQEMPADQAAFIKDKICLSSTVRERLELDEWRPIIASSLQFYFSKKIRRKYDFASFIAVMWLVAGFIGFLVIIHFFNMFLQPLTKGTLGALILLLGVQLILVGMFEGWHYLLLSSRRLWLTSDSLTAQSIGAEELLRTFRKLESMNLWEQKQLEQRKNFLIAPAGQSGRPSLKERIRNLETARLGGLLSSALG